MSKRKHFFRNQWRERVNPAFARYWAAIKANWALPRINDPKEGEQAFRRNLKEMTAASREFNQELQKISNGISAQVWSALLAGLDGEGQFSGGEAGKSYVTNPESNTFFRTLVFLKYGISFRELMVELEKNPSVYRKLKQIHNDFRRFRTKVLPLSELKLKFNLTHFQIMVQGLDFGILDLNEWELARCFDEICPCAQRHSVEYMKKFRVRVKKACEHVLSSSSKPTTIDISG